MAGHQPYHAQNMRNSELIHPMYQKGYHEGCRDTMDKFMKLLNDKENTKEIKIIVTTEEFERIKKEKSLIE